MYSQKEKKKENNKQAETYSVYKNNTGMKHGTGVEYYSSDMVTQCKLAELIGRGLKPTVIIPHTNNVVIQRATTSELEGQLRMIIHPLFEQRVKDKTATTGKHNYAVDLSNMLIVRSSTSSHAEIQLLAASSAQQDERVNLISEYKPCKSCMKALAQIEEQRGITVHVSYLLAYEEKGDGDVDITREFYKKCGKLEGGGLFVYKVVE